MFKCGFHLTRSARPSVSDMQNIVTSDTPAWVEGIGTMAATFVALGGLVLQNRHFRTERAERLRLEAEVALLRKSDQARKVSAHLTGGGAAPVQLNVINANDIIITAFEAVAIAEYPEGSKWKGSFYPPGTVMIVNPGSSSGQLEPPKPNLSFRHEVAFNDDNGIRWYKYGPEGLCEVPRDFTLLTGLG
jgi:hypothetical protein